MDYETMYGGGYVCSICGQWNKTSAICTHPTVVPDIKLKDMENKIPTAEEFCREKHNKIDPRTSWIDFNKEVMIEFAKLHVEAALKAAAENADAIPYSEGAVGQCGVDKQSILNAYPLDLIK